MSLPSGEARPQSSAWASNPGSQLSLEPHSLVLFLLNKAVPCSKSESL